MKTKRKYILLGTIILLVFCLILLLTRCNGGKPIGSLTGPLTVDEGAVSWEGNQNLADKNAPGKIAIPGFESLSFIADQTTQHVNFYNPETNSCLFLMSLYVDGQLYWQSGYVEAGKGYYVIELREGIPAGKYAGELLIRCFRPSGAALNSARVTFDLTVLEDN